MAYRPAIATLALSLALIHCSATSARADEGVPSPCDCPTDPEKNPQDWERVTLFIVPRSTEDCSYGPRRNPRIDDERIGQNSIAWKPAAKSRSVEEHGFEIAIRGSYETARDPAFVREQAISRIALDGSITTGGYALRHAHCPSGGYVRIDMARMRMEARAGQRVPLWYLVEALVWKGRGQVDSAAPGCGQRLIESNWRVDAAERYDASSHGLARAGLDGDRFSRQLCGSVAGRHRTDSGGWKRFLGHLLPWSGENAREAVHRLYYHNPALLLPYLSSSTSRFRPRLTR